MLFPDLLSRGCGDFEVSQQRQSKLSLQNYFQQGLLNADGWFAKNIEYLFCAQYATDIKQIQSDSNLTFHLTYGKILGGQRINAGMLKTLTFWIILYELNRHINS